MEIGFVQMEVPVFRGNADQALGTGLRGYVSATHSELLERFGAPNLGGVRRPLHRSRVDKIACGWILLVGSEPVTVYAYKVPAADVPSTTSWNVGGRSAAPIVALFGDSFVGR